MCARVCVCVLYRQAGRVVHSADEEQSARSFVPDQEEEGPVHPVGQVARRRGGTGVLPPLRSHLHHHLVVDAGELEGLRRDLLKLGVC